MATYIFVEFQVTPTAGGTTVAYPNGATLSVNEDLTIVAVYAISQHTVTFQSYPIPNVNYSQPSGQAPFSVTVNDGQTITIQAPPEVNV